MPGITIKDIAQVAGVSHPTVSKALNNSPGVNGRTRERIQKIAKQLNYVPNLAAKRLANQRTKSIGFIWPQIEGLFFYHLCSTMQREALNRNIDVLASMSDPSKALHTFHEHFIDLTLGWFFPQWSPSAEFIKERERYPGEMIIVGGGRMENAHTILIDRSRGIYEAMEHLARTGHSKVAYIGEAGEKSDGYLRATLDLGLCYHRNRLITTDSQYYDGTSANLLEVGRKFSTLWKSDQRPSAVILDSQDTAFGLVNVLRELRISIPDDLSLVSYDDIPELSIYQVPLTTCGPAIGEIVRTLLDFYEDFYEHRLPSKTVQKVIYPKLMIRGSTRPV